MDLRTWRKNLGEVRCEPLVELCSRKFGPQKRDPALLCHRCKLFGKALALGDKDARQVEVDESFPRLAPILDRKRTEVFHLCFTQYMNALGGEPLQVASKHQAGARYLRDTNWPVEAHVTRENL